MHADHPTLVIITDSFLQIARSSRYSAHPDRGTYPRCASNMRCLTHTRNPPVLGLHVRFHVHLPPQRHTAILCGRTLGSPGRPYIEEVTLFFSSSFTGPSSADLPSHFSVGEHLVERAAPSNQISKSRRLFEEQTESRRFSISNRGSEIDHLIFWKKSDGKVKCEHYK